MEVMLGQRPRSKEECYKKYVGNGWKMQNLKRGSLKKNQHPSMYIKSQNPPCRLNLIRKKCPNAPLTGDGIRDTDSACPSLFSPPTVCSFQGSASKSV